VFASRERELISGIDSDLKLKEDSATASAEFAWPAIALALVFLCLTILAWPHFVERIVRLDRRHGDMRPVVYAFQAFLGALTLAIVLRRKWINSQFGKIFPSTRQFLIAAGMVLLSFCLGVAAIEGLARALHLPFRAKSIPSENPLARFDSELGWSYIPNQNVTQEFGSDHRKVPMFFDDLGCRVRKPGERADRSVPTALFVGDSYTFGHGVTYEESFVGRLAMRPDFPFQVVNLGVQAYGTDQSLLLLKHQFRKFNTKLVVYTFTSMQIGRNEVYDKRIQHPDDLSLGTKPLFALKPDGSLYLAKNALEFKDYSYSRVWAALQILKLRWGPKPNVRLTRALIQEMKNFVESNGARFVVVDWYDDPSFPWGLDVDVIRLGANAPAGWSDWIIPGETHPDARANLYASEYIARELQRILAKERVTSVRHRSGMRPHPDPSRQSECYRPKVC
jgi:hypothetical protein